PSAVAAAPRPLPEASVTVPELLTTTVTRGDSLWRISRRVYGQGVRYTAIYEANPDQIQNPHRIWPGQIFVVPQAR
ncbi:MAG: LysM peptidoglycan-binding domain-containing protein, partial [Methylobacteriaceae bacterium]|nr:LysM peptidoglycan-binding domain-containing protein [Methylobacteriaceae bacterium]